MLSGNVSVCAAEKEKSWQAFSALSAERGFWEEWQEKHHCTDFLDLFPVRYAPKQMDATLVTIAQQAASFVLIIETGTNSSTLRIIALAKTNDLWEQTQWELVDMKNFKATIKKSVVESPRIDEGILKSLSECPVTFIPDDRVDDAESTIMFVKHSGQSNRLAIHNPGQLYEKERSQTPVASAMKSLLQSAGVLSSDTNEGTKPENHPKSDVNQGAVEAGHK